MKREYEATVLVQITSARGETKTKEKSSRLLQEVPTRRAPGGACGSLAPQMNTIVPVSRDSQESSSRIRKRVMHGIPVNT